MTFGKMNDLKNTFNIIGVISIYENVVFLIRGHCIVGRKRSLALALETWYLLSASVCL